MQKLTLQHCIDKTHELEIPVYGDMKWRGKCKVEDADLASFFAWVRRNYPQYEMLIFHPENEMPTNGGASFAYHTKSKNKGRLDGLADVICLPVKLGAPAFVMELKRVDFSKSCSGQKRQKGYMRQLMCLNSQIEHGAFACICLGLDNAKQAFTEYVEKYG